MEEYVEEPVEKQEKMAEEVINLAGVSKNYEVGGTVVKALDDADLTINRGDFVSIVGPSGSGKSTMMNIIGCLDRDFDGEYKLAGGEVKSFTEDQLTEARNREIGFVFQDFDLIGNLSVEENVELPLIYMRAPKDERARRVADAVERVGLEQRAQHRPSELSGGQQQRAAIARAIVTDPSIILADEPTGNLDSKTSADIMEIFHELHENGNTIVLITHDEDVAKQASRIFRIRDGKVSELRS